MALEQIKSEYFVLVSELSKTVSDKQILKNVSFSFSARGIHGILAPNGAEGTALAEILAGVDTRFEGMVDFDGLSGTDLRKKVGYVPKHMAAASSVTAEEYLNLVGMAKGISSEIRIRQMTEALDLTGLFDRRKRLMTHLTPDELKRLALAAALLGNPSVLVLDDVTEQASFEERQTWYGLIRMLGKLKTVLLVTASYDAAHDVCEDAAFLCNGQVAATGSFEALEETLNQKLVEQGMEALPLRQLCELLPALSEEKENGIE